MRHLGGLHKVVPRRPLRLPDLLGCPLFPLPGILQRPLQQVASGAQVALGEVLVQALAEGSQRQGLFQLAHPFLHLPGPEEGTGVENPGTGVTAVQAHRLPQPLQRQPEQPPVPLLSSRLHVDPPQLHPVGGLPGIALRRPLQSVHDLLGVLLLGGSSGACGVLLTQEEVQGDEEDEERRQADGSPLEEGARRESPALL